MFSYNSAVLKCNLCHISIWNTEDYLCVMLSDRDISRKNMHVFESSCVIFTCIKHEWSVSRILTPHPPCWLDLNWKVTVMCKEETQEDVLCCAVLILSPGHFLTLSSLFCREINVEAAPHARERRAPQLRRRTLSCRTMWTDTLINTHINTNKWCCGFYTLTNIIPTCLMEEKNCHFLLRLMQIVHY